MENQVPFGDTEHRFPEVFNTIPQQPTNYKPGCLMRKQLEQFFEDGYVIIEDYLDQTLLAEAKASVSDMVDVLAQMLHKAGKIKETYEEHGLYTRLAMIEKEFPPASVVLVKMRCLSEPIKKIWSSEKLLNVMEQLLGTKDIQGHPIWTLRPKTPQTEIFSVPWHQDIGYLDNDSHSVLQVTAWIPLIDATVKNGCMQVIKGGHKTGKILPHYGCWRSTHYIAIDEEEMSNTLGLDMDKDVVTCEIPFGGMLLFNNILPHRSLPNLSNDIRWSVDLRWQKTELPVGFYGLKHGVPMRSEKDPSLTPDWEKFDGNPTFEEALNIATKNGQEFDPLLPGPWMAKWKITNKNAHVIAQEKLMAESECNSTRLA